MLKHWLKHRKKPWAVLLLLFIHVMAFCQPFTKSVKPIVTGETRSFYSAVLHENRLLNIRLPDSFSRSVSYPVFYLLDGSLNEDFPHIAGLLQFFHLSYGMPDCILVGIANVDRKRDFTFATQVAEQKKSYPTTGHSALFIRFIKEELKPYVQSLYKSGGDDYLIGQSLGGLLAIETLLKNPELFTGYLIVSPSLWWDNESLLHASDSLLSVHAQALEGKQVFVTAGGKEDPVMQRDARQFAEKLDSAGFKNTRVHFLLLPEENHATILHQAIDEDLKRLVPYAN